MHDQLKNSNVCNSSSLHPLDNLVSVVTPAFNEARFLPRVIASVAQQTTRVLEHIIVNDGSTDESAALLEEMQELYPHLVVISQARSGAAAARNQGISAARARYIAFLDADDAWYPRKVESQIRFMENTGSLFSYGDYVELHYAERTRSHAYNLPLVVDHERLLAGCPIGCLTVAYNQYALGKRYMPVVHSGHDWGLWLSITRQGIDAHKYPGVHAAYSNGRPSLSSRKFRKFLNIYDIYRLQEGLPRGKAMLHTLQHSLLALAKKSRLLWARQKKDWPDVG